MTNEEAIKRCKELISQDKDVVLTYNAHMKAVIQPYFVDAIEKAIEALEKAEKYRLHDLIKDPNDLPNDGDTVMGISASKNEYTDIFIYHKDNDWTWEYRDYHAMYAQKIIAWKYIELFERGE
ncbi:MAG: hypothetical protein KBS66_07510 [Eubacterium sp.]|nr:hypothetical protein [Candidatus Colimonas fimequi]